MKRGKAAMSTGKEHIEKQFDGRRKYIERSIKRKIALYEPLELKPLYERFHEWVRENDVNVPVNGDVETYLDGLIKDFLVESAYYALGENYIQRILMNKTGTSDPNDIRLLETGDYVRERLEKDRLKRLKGFKEKSKFKTFLTTAVIRLLYDAWRHKRSIEENVTKYGPDFDAVFDPPVEDPLNLLLKSEDDHFKRKAAAFLPRVLDTLDFKERLAIRLKYEESMKISAIARTLKRTRFKTEQFINRIERKISMELLKRTAPPGLGRQT